MDISVDSSGSIHHRHLIGLSSVLSLSTACTSPSFLPLHWRFVRCYGIGNCILSYSIYCSPNSFTCKFSLQWLACLVQSFWFVMHHEHWIIPRTYFGYPTVVQSQGDLVARQGDWKQVPRSCRLLHTSASWCQPPWSLLEFPFAFVACRKQHHPRMLTSVQDKQHPKQLWARGGPTSLGSGLVSDDRTGPSMSTSSS